MRACKVFTPATLFIALIASAAVETASANPIFGTFGGTLDTGFDTPADHPGATLGISNGDTFTGSFEYDSSTGDPSYFRATVAGQSFVAQSLQMQAQLFDGALTDWSLVGQLSNGLYMSLGLTNGSPVFGASPPQSLSSDDWFLKAFEIRSSPLPPIEILASGLPAIAAEYTGNTPERDFFLRTVSIPEPETLSMFLLAVLGGLGFARFSNLVCFRRE